MYINARNDISSVKYSEGYASSRYLHIYLAIRDTCREQQELIWRREK